MIEKKKIKAVCMLSGGLDSALSAKIMVDMGIDVYAVNAALPWGCYGSARAKKIANKLGIPIIVINIGEEYLDVIKNAKYGYGVGINPCIDCRVYMLMKAKVYMDKIGAEFIFTGEIIGQRPMSQLRQSMRIVETKSGLLGRLLRPLCAKHLEPTIPEQKGMIERNRLLDFCGRSRKAQINLADSLGIDEYAQPAGGCLLTDKHFTNRLKDVFKYGYKDFNETLALKWGRHYRITDKFKCIIGRNVRENEIIKNYADSNDTMLEFKDLPGPTLILKGNNPANEVLKIAAGLVQYHSKFRESGPMDVNYSLLRSQDNVFKIKARKLLQGEIERMKI